MKRKSRHKKGCVKSLRSFNARVKYYAKRFFFLGIIIEGVRTSLGRKKSIVKKKLSLSRVFDIFTMKSREGMRGKIIKK